MPQKGQRFTTYTPEFKLKAVNMYLEEGLGYNRVTKELNLISSSYVRRWVKNYRDHGIQGLEERRGKASTSSNQKNLPH
ncbi:transposase [Brevibacillus sp. NRS-1366]|uniref:transposase n=1 Tax=Brevibacillus sp. NRS-1366 TaxID=3233899 RepID=UPI003D1A738F